MKLLLTVIIPLLLNSCSITEDNEGTIPFAMFDTVQIPKDTVVLDNENLQLINGEYFLNKQPFSGYVKEYYKNQQAKAIGGFFNGKQNGQTVTFYEDGTLRDRRSFKENKSYGEQIGYWENGNQKFEYHYLDDKREGVNKQWYESGQLHTLLTFENDKEAGMQQAWRENGKKYLNYEAKDGFRYGLQKTNLCYTLEEEKFKFTK